MTILMECEKRRKNIMKTLGKGLLVLPSMPESIYSNDTDYPYRQHSNILYFVGYPEPATTCVIENNGKEIISHLFVPKRDPLFETWNGRRYGVDGAKEAYNMDKTYENTEFKEEFTKLLKNYETVHLITGENKEIDEIVLNVRNEAMRSRDRKGKGPVNLVDPKYEIDHQKLIKSDYEVDLLRKSAEISAIAHTRAMKVTKSGMHEYDIEAIINYEFRKRGARGVAYQTIAGSGVNGTILHYVENSSKLKDGELLLVDAGSEYHSYAADITRTWPVNGKFTDAQREIYEVVLSVQKEIIAMIKPGISFKEINDLSIRRITEGLVKYGLLEGEIDDLIEEEKHRRFYMHGLGHWLGIDTHDTGSVSREADLIKGCYLTVEPGIYIPNEDDIPSKYRGIGIRIEDDVLVLENGCEVLTSGVVKEIEEIEAIVGTERMP